MERVLFRLKKLKTRVVKKLILDPLEVKNFDQGDPLQIYGVTNSLLETALKSNSLATRPCCPEFDF